MQAEASVALGPEQHALPVAGAGSWKAQNKVLLSRLLLPLGLSRQIPKDPIQCAETGLSGLGTLEMCRQVCRAAGSHMWCSSLAQPVPANELCTQGPPQQGGLHAAGLRPAQCAGCNIQQPPSFMQVGLNEPVQPTLRWQPRKESIYAVAISDDGVLCAAGSTANMVQASCT